MPGWLQPFAQNQPATVTINAVRALFEGGPAYHDLKGYRRSSPWGAVCAAQRADVARALVGGLIGVGGHGE